MIRAVSMVPSQKSVEHVRMAAIPAPVETGKP